MKHEALHESAHNAGTNTRLAIKRVATKVADVGLAGIVVAVAFTAAVAPRFRKR